jgi:hypothetical protein
MNKDEVDLNDPRVWFIADSMDDFDSGGTSGESSRRMPESVLSEMGSIINEAITNLERHGHLEEAQVLRRRVRALTSRS